MITVAFDFDEDVIRAVALKRTPKSINLVRAGTVKMEIDPDTGQEEKMRIREEALGELLTASKIHTRQARLVLRDPHIYVRHLKLPRVPEEELKKAIKWQADKILPFPASEAAIDFQIIDKGELGRPEEIEIILLAAPNDLIQNFVNILQRRKINLNLIDIPAFSVVKCFSRNYASGEGASLILDFSSSLVSMAVVNESLLQFSRQMRLASKRIFSEGESGIDFLVKKVNTSILYYQLEFPQVSVTRVILSGETALLDGLIDSLGSKLKIRTEIADPLRNIHLVGRSYNLDELKQESAGYMAAVGLAL